MPSRSAILMLCGATALAACDQPAPPARHEPLFVPAAGGEAYLPPLAPAWEALPPAPSAPIRRASYVPDYGYAERAYAIDRAFYEAPPDYGFDYLGVEPWAWRTYDGYLVFAEPVAYGYRYYYYEPGYAYPFFIRTPDYAFSFGVGGVLVTIYSSSGVLLPYDEFYVLAPRAGRYWLRAHDLYSASVIRQVPVVYDVWLSRRTTLVRSQDPWMAAAVRQPGWRGYRDRHDAQELRHFTPERERRERAVERAERQEVRQALRREDREDRHIAREDRRGADRAAQVERGDERRAERTERRDDVRMQHQPRPEHGDQARAERQARRDEAGPRPERARPERPGPERMSPERGAAEPRGREDRPQRQAERRAEPPRMAAPERRAEIRPDRGPERRAEIRPERGPEFGRDIRPEPAVRDRAPPVQRIERPQMRAEAPPRPEPAPRAEPPRQERAQARDAGRAGRDAAADERGKPDKPRKD